MVLRNCYFCPAVLFQIPVNAAPCAALARSLRGPCQNTRLVIHQNMPITFYAGMSHFARVVKGVDLRSTAGNCAWVRTPQVTF